MAQQPGKTTERKTVVAPAKPAAKPAVEKKPAPAAVKKDEGLSGDALVAAIRAKAILISGANEEAFDALNEDQRILLLNDAEKLVKEEQAAKHQAATAPASATRHAHDLNHDAPDVPAGEGVIVTVPKAFKLRLDDHQVIEFNAGVQRMLPEHADHWFSKAQGVVKFEG